MSNELPPTARATKSRVPTSVLLLRVDSVYRELEEGQAKADETAMVKVLEAMSPGRSR